MTIFQVFQSLLTQRLVHVACSAPRCCSHYAPALQLLPGLRFWYGRR